MNRCVGWMLLAAAVLVSGCAQPVKKQAYDSQGGARIHTVLIGQAPNQDSFETIMVGHPAESGGLIGGLIALADMQAKTSRVTAAVDKVQTRLQNRFSEILKQGLDGQGYDTRIVVLPAIDEPDNALPFLRQQGPVDAALVVLLAGRYLAAGPTADYFPYLVVRAKVFDMGSGAALYEDTFTYGYDDKRGETVHFPSDPKYRFPQVDDMVADPARVREGWLAGLQLIAAQILTDLQRKP